MPSHFDEVERSNYCPCCGHELVASRVIVDLNTNTIALGEQRWRVVPKLAEFLAALAARSPRGMSLLELGDALWGVHAPEGDLLRQNVSVYASMARRMLRGTGATIEQTSARGYRLFVAP